MPKKITWTQEQEEYVLTHYKEESNMDMGTKLGVSAPYIAGRLRTNGIVRCRESRTPRKQWTEYEVSYIREHFPHETAGDIADHLGTSDTMVLKKAREMGLKKAPDYDPRHFGGRYVRNYKNNIVKYNFKST